MIELAEHPTFGFGSGQDLRVMGSTQHRVCLGLSDSLSAPAHNLSPLSLSLINK